MDKQIVLKVGGSVIYTENLDVNFPVLRKLKLWYEKAVDEYSKIVIVTGGGQLSRMIQGKISANIKEENFLHQIGMSVTQISANIIAGYLNDKEIYIPRKLGDAYEYLNDEKEARMVSGGLKIGWSTDMDAVVYADIIRTDRVFKVSNIEYIYDEDPRVNPNASPIRDISWNEYMKLFHINNGDNHSPNSNIPIDPLCAQFANSKGIGIHVTGGGKIELVEDFGELLQGGSYVHT